MFTESDALAVAKKAAPDQPEDWPYMVEGQMSLYNRGIQDGQSLDSKRAYWTGVKEGLYKASWIADGKRYVGPVAVQDNLLSRRVAEIDVLMQEACK